MSTVPQQPFPETASARRLVEFIQSLGPTFIKIGQYLALRPDLISQSYADEFLRLTDDVPSFSFAEGRAIVEAELGPLESRFAWFSQQPTAAGSLAQVHRARTLDGVEVAVKILRPGIEAQVARDLARLRPLARLLELSGAVKILSVKELVAEFEVWMKSELDLRNEYENLQRMYLLARHQRDMFVPKPVPELCSQRVLTAEYFHGVPFSHLLRELRKGRESALRQFGLDADVLAERLLYATLVQVFRFQFFHADTHPGNLIALSDNRVGFVDFGLTATLHSTFQRGLMRYLSAIFADDTDEMYQGLLELLEPSTHTNLEAFRADFESAASEWTHSRRQKRERGPESPIRRYLIAVVTAARTHGLKIPTGVLSMYRSLLTTETVAAQLGSSADLASVGRKFFTELQWEQALRIAEPQEVQATVLRAIEASRDVPNALVHIVEDLANGRFRLQVVSKEAAEAQQRSNDRARLIALAAASIGVSVLAVGASSWLLFGVIPVFYLFGVPLIGIYLWMVLLWRRLS